MVKKLRRKGGASAAPPPKTATPGPSKTEKIKKRRLVKADPEKLKAAALESAATAGASASAPSQKTVNTSAPAGAATSNSVATESNRGDNSKKEKMKGREDTGKGEGSKAGRKETVKGPEEQRTNQKEKRRMTGKEEEDGDKSGPGFIFMCNTRTKPECYRNGVFGLPGGKMDVVEKITPGAKLFLYDFDLKLMYGVYKATTRGQKNLVRHAFNGMFPAQVKFSVDLDCLPVPESSFKHAIKENYCSKGRFTQELSSTQVRRLLALFKPIGQSQSHPQGPQHIEDRRESYVYDERRPSHHVDARAGAINIHASLPSEPQHSLVLDHRQIPTGLELRQAPIALASHHMPLTRELQQVPPVYYHQVAPNSLYHQPHVDTVHERTATEVHVRDPLLSRDYGGNGALSGELAARTERLDELYRSYKLSTSTIGIQQDPRGIYSENIQRPVPTRVSGPSVPVSTRYSFAGPPSY